VALIPHAVEHPELEPRNTKAGDRKKLLFLGRIHPKKGLSELLKAWAKAQSQKPEALSNWELLIAGWDDGGHEAGLRELAGDSVEFVGSKYGEEKERLLREVDAFVLPSFSEGLPMSVLEAWSFGLPAVMTDFCNLPAGFAAEAAIRVEPDTDSIFQGLEKLAAMPEGERADMGIRGRNLVEEKFTWPKVAKEMRQVYEWCLTGNNPPGCMEF
jgi:poly(glycerol-phosphate) alpha-glucosyltransferase